MGKTLSAGDAREYMAIKSALECTEFWTDDFRSRPLSERDGITIEVTGNDGDLRWELRWQGASRQSVSRPLRTLRNAKDDARSNLLQRMRELEAQVTDGDTAWDM